MSFFHAWYYVMLKKVSLIASTKSTRIAMLNQIQFLLDKYVEIESYSG